MKDKCQVGCCKTPHCTHQYSQGDPCWKKAYYRCTNADGFVSYDCKEHGDELLDLLEKIKDRPVGISYDEAGRELYRPPGWKPPIFEKLVS